VVIAFVRRSLDRVAGGPIDRRLTPRTDEIRYALGVVQCRQSQLLQAPLSLRDAEFKVFSQFGEDGIIQFLTRRLAPPDTFVEIGVSDYAESNTRFLAMKDNWRGAIFNGGSAHVDFLQTSEMAWRYSIDAVSAFVTRETVNHLICSTGIEGEIGLLSIDVDGIDYWLWEAVDVVTPWIVVIEYNSVFGAEQAVTVPYDPAFTASSAHWTQQFSGASLAALHHLGRQKGYRLVGVTSQGVNAFFVREDIAGDLWSLSPAEAYVRSRVRTARDRHGALTYTGSDHRALLTSMSDRTVVDVESGQDRTIGDLYGV
jgi:hypothetical protein